MRILLITQHYWPETVGTARRAWTLAEYFVQQGHSVRVLCGWPNHPSMWRLFGGRHDGPAHHQGVEILRVPVYRTSLKYTRTWKQGEPLTPLARLHRLISYGSWVVSGAARSLIQGLHFDVVLAISPLPTGVLAGVAQLRLGVPLVFDLQDIWPEAAFQAGILHGERLYHALEAVEREVYARAQALVVLSEGFKQHLVTRGFPAEKLHVIRNGVDPGPSMQVGREGERWRKERGWSPEDTVILYAGNLGVMQDLDVLLDAAAQLKHVLNLHFLLVGDGVDRERLQQKAEGLGLTRCAFLGHLSAEAMPRVLAGADVCFLSLKPGMYTPGTVPSKLYDYMMAGKPVLNLVQGDAAEALAHAQGGMNLPEGDVRALKVAIFGMHADPGMRTRLGLNARGWAQREVSQNQIGSQYAHLLSQLTPQNGVKGAAAPLLDSLKGQRPFS